MSLIRNNLGDGAETRRYSETTDPVATVVLDAAPEFSTIIPESSGVGVRNVTNLDTVAENSSSVSISCSSLGQGGEMLINTIEVSTEELMNIGHMNSEEIEFIYSPNIQFHVEPISSAERNGGEEQVCEIENTMEPAVQLTLSDSEPTDNQAGISVPRVEARPRLVANQGKEVNEDAISKAILQAATNIIRGNNAKKASAGTVNTLVKRTRKFTRSGPKSPASTTSSVDADFIITNVQGAPSTQKSNISPLPSIDNVIFTTIDGKRLTLQAGSQVIQVPPAAQRSFSGVVNESGGLRSVIISPEVQVLSIESQLPTIIEAANVAQQTFTAALKSQKVYTQTSLKLNPNASSTNISNRSQKSTTIQLEVPGGGAFQLQKYYSQPGLCRVCLLVKENLTSIFEDIAIDSHGMVENARGPNASHKFNILAALKTLLDVEVEYNDGLPEMICMDCYDQLMDFSVYRKRIAIGQTKLNQILEQVKDSNAPTFIPSLGEVDMAKTDIYRYPSSIITANNILRESQYSHLVLRKISDRIWDKLFSSMSTIVGYKSGKLKKLEVYACEAPYVSGFFCYTCNSTVHGTKADYAEHYSEFHGVKSSEDVLYPCDICGNSYPMKDTSAISQSYPEHWIQHFFLHECTFCSRKLPSAKGLWVHKKSAHGTREKIFNCDDKNCEKSFFKKAHLDVHKQTHLGNTVRKEHISFCHLCGKGLNSSLTAHINSVHGSERPWRCDICQKQFKRKEILLGHRESVHLKTKKFACEICGEAFRSQSAKTVHLLRHKGDKRHACTLCSKKFFSTYALKSHMLKHQEVGDFPCSQCGKVFKRASYLEEHKRTHTGEKPYKCPICGKAIRMKSNYFKHLRIHKRKNEIT